MNYITTVNVQNLLGNVRLHPTSVAYIQRLVTPYAAIIDTAVDAQSLVNWIPVALTNIVLPDKTVVKRLNELPGGDLLEAAKRITVEELLKAIIKATNDEVLFYKGDNMILPWDIKESMFYNDSAIQKFGITKGDYTLPIIVNNQHEYLMSEELTMGLLLYSYASGNPISITMFGVPLSTDYYAQPNRYTKFCSNKRRSEYQVDIAGQTYCFITSEFMQGFSTGAQWFGDDHHKYWSNLISYELDPNGVAVNF